MAIEAANKVVHGNDLTYITTLYKAYFQAKESGKGLSTNDLTDALLAKLNAIASGAEVNVIEEVQVNGTALTASGKSVNVPVPTTTSELTNDSGFLTAHQSLTAYAKLASPTFTGTPKAPTASAGTNTTQIATTAFVTTAVANAIGSITGISYSVVTTLPSTGENGVIYLVSNSGTSPNVYDEYIWISSSSSFEKIGTTETDLSNYVTYDDMEDLTTTEIATLLNL